MNTPILDNRNKEDIIRQVEMLARQYVPEWRCDGNTADPATALTELFGEMFSQSIDRFNAIPQKMYTELLNFLGVKEKTSTPASGIMQFSVHENVADPVFVPEGTYVYTEDDEGENMVFTTERDVTASPAKLTGIYYVDSVNGILQKREPGVPMNFFGPDSTENLHGHQMMVGHDEALGMTDAGVIELSLETEKRELSPEVLNMLSDTAHAEWSYHTEEGWKAFAAVSNDGRRIRLRKDTVIPITAAAADEEDEEDEARYCLRVILKNIPGDIRLSAVRVRSIPESGTLATDMISDNIPIEQGVGGYCFGRIPAPYNSFYIRSDEAFSKHGAKLLLDMELSFMTFSDVEQEPQYAFDRSIIDKESAVRLKPDDVYVRQVIWEYFNGIGWSLLPVSGSRNPFSGKEEGPFHLSFVVPDNIRKAIETTSEGYFIRARVTEIENQFSQKPRYIVPFIRSIRIRWDYPDVIPARCLKTENNLDVREITEAEKLEDLELMMYRDFVPAPRAMYLCFDHAPEGMPFSMAFMVRGRAELNNPVAFEVFDGQSFTKVPVEDDTENFRHSGVVYMYNALTVERTMIFSQEGYWVRLILDGMKPGTAPMVLSIATNAVRAVQKERDQEQTFSTDIEEAVKKIRLRSTPVLGLEIWVDESSAILKKEVEEMLFRSPEDIRIQEENDTIVSCLVRWHETDSMMMCGPKDRVYTLDPFSGEVTFGDGKFGKVPPAGHENIHAIVDFGGGNRGNLPEYSIKDFLLSVPRISSLKNITPMTGGTDKMSEDRIKLYGNKSIRHRGRAVSPRDFEELTASNFISVSRVKCFSNMDARGNKVPGHICVVIKPETGSNEDTSWELSRNVREFLAKRCDCTLIENNRLQVRPSIEMELNVSLTIAVKDLTRAVRTQQALEKLISDTVDERWAQKDIGEQYSAADLYAGISSIPNVAAVKQLLIEGVYYEDGIRHVIPVQEDTEMPFVTVKNGVHKVRIE